MQDVFKLRAADIYRVLDIERINGYADRDATHRRRPAPAGARGPERARRARSRGSSRCGDLDTIVGTTVDGLDRAARLRALAAAAARRGRPPALHDREPRLPGRGRRLRGRRRRGSDRDGRRARRADPRRQPAPDGEVRRDRPAVVRGTAARSARAARSRCPGSPTPRAGSRCRRSSLGQLVGVLVVESTRAGRVRRGRRGDLLTVVAAVVAQRDRGRNAPARRPTRPARRARRAPAATGRPRPGTRPRPTHVRFFAVDGSTFLDGDYLIKGVAGRILWSLLGHYDARAPRRVHEQGGAARPVARAARVPRQPRQPPHPAEAAARRARRRPSGSRRPGRGRFRLLVDAALRLDEVVAPVD